MSKLIFGAAILAATLTAAPALACTGLVPNGNESTNIRSGPSYDFDPQDEVASGLGTFTYCGTWSWDINGRVDDNGDTFKWLRVNYRINGRRGWNTGWVASIVVSSDD